MLKIALVGTIADQQAGFAFWSNRTPHVRPGGRGATRRLEQPKPAVVGLSALHGLGKMSGHWTMQVPTGKTYAKRAEECRWLAAVCPQEFREDYLKLADEYELLARVEKSAA